MDIPVDFRSLKNPELPREGTLWEIGYPEEMGGFGVKLYFENYRIELNPGDTMMALEPENAPVWFYQSHALDPESGEFRFRYWSTGYPSGERVVFVLHDGRVGWVLARLFKTTQLKPIVIEETK